MRKPQTIVTVALVLCLIGFLLTIFFFFFLHDIFNEYVSIGILNHLNITLSGELPEWTSTKGEWGIIRISYLFRFCFFIFCAFVLFKLVNRLKTEHQ